MPELHRKLPAHREPWVPITGRKILRFGICLPATAPRAAPRSKMCFLKLLSSVDPDASHGFGFNGTFFPPGKIVSQADLHPTPEYPATPILLEQSLAPAHGIPGHRRCDTITILWRWEPELNSWRELGRTVSIGSEWAIEMRPLAIHALTEARGGAVEAAIDESAIARRIHAFLDHEVSVLRPPDRVRFLAMIHDQIAMRICA